MSSIRAAISQVKRQLVLNRVFSVLLNALLIFGLCAVILELLGLSWYYGGLPALLYFIPMSVKKVREVKLKEAEEKIPQLEWQLRTTEDTIGKENEVVESLHQRVYQILHNLKSSYLVDGKTLSYKMGGVVALVGIFFVLSLFQVVLVDMARPNALADLFSKDPGSGLFGNENDSLLRSTYGDRDIYGEKDVAQLGSDELDLELNRENNEQDYDNIKDAQNRDFNTKGSLGDIGASADASYQEYIDEENKILVKNYFEKLAED